MSTPIDTIWVVDVVFLAEPVTVTPVPTVVLDGGMVSPAVIGPVAAVAGCGATASSPAIASMPASRAVITRRPEVLSSMIPFPSRGSLGGGDGRVRERVVGGVRDPGVGAEGGRTGHIGEYGQGDRGRIARRQVEAAVDQVARVAGVAPVAAHGSPVVDSRGPGNPHRDPLGRARRVGGRADERHARADRRRDRTGGQPRGDSGAWSRRRLLACHHSPYEPQHTGQHGRNDSSQKYYAHDFPRRHPRRSVTRPQLRTIRRVSDVTLRRKAASGRLRARTAGS